MDVFSDNWLVNILAFLITFFCVALAYYKYTFQYWKNKNLPYLEPKIPGGNNDGLAYWMKPMNESMRRHYKSLRKLGLRHGGIYLGTKPIYMPIDLDIVKHILLKDFNHFVGRGIYHNEKSDPISAHLFAIEGSKWRSLRSKLTPTFTSGKMKMMFQTMIECGNPMLEYIEEKGSKGKAIDIKDVLGLFTTDVIGSCAFGLDCNSFKDPNSTFASYGRKTFQLSKLMAIKQLFLFNFPKVARFFNMVSTSKDLSDFYLNITKTTVEYREKNNISRKDFMQLLIDLKNNDNPDLGKLSVEEIAAQAFVFFIAGFETTASTLTFCFLELAHHIDIQERVRQEINEVLEKHDGKVTYESLMEMKYMTQVIDETLRKYPPVLLLRRKCSKEYQIPDSDVILDKGTMAIMSVYGIHHDPEYYPDPETFDPERFSEENTKKRHPFAYLPFGEGPRVCIGMRFGFLEVKIALVLLLTKFRVTLNEKTVYPIELDPHFVVLSSKSPILLNAEKL